MTYPPLPSTDLVISSGNLVIDQNTTVNSITVAPGGKLTLSTATLTANNGVTLQSDASGTGTLVDNSMINPQSVSGTVNWYKMYWMEPNTRKLRSNRKNGQYLLSKRY